MSAHIHAALMAQYAQDAAETDRPFDRWEMRDADSVGSYLQCPWHPEWSPHVNYRRKPRTQMVNGIEVPAPMRDAPRDGARYFLADPTHFGFCATPEWSGDRWDCDWLERGLVHATKEAAVANAMAMIGRKS